MFGRLKFPLQKIIVITETHKKNRTMIRVSHKFHSKKQNKIHFQIKFPQMYKYILSIRKLLLIIYMHVGYF